MPERRFIQSRLVDYRSDPPALMPEPVSRLLYDPRAGDGEPVHAIEAAAVSELGVRLETRYVLARGSDGRPHLWLQRQRFARLRSTTRGLAFDVLSPELPPPSRARILADVELTVDSVTIVGTRVGIADAVITVSAVNNGHAPLDDARILIEHGRSPRWLPAVHIPVSVSRLMPGETRSFDIEAAVPLDDATTDVRASLAVSRPGTAPIIATHAVELTPAEPDPAIRLELTGPLAIDGPVASVPVSIRADLPGTAVDQIRLDIWSAGRDTWTPLTGWRTGGAATDAGGTTVAGLVSWNARQHAGTVAIRARVGPDATGESRIGASVALEAAAGAVPSPLLGISLAIREIHPVPAGFGALCVLVLDNAGETDLAGLTLAVEQRQPREHLWHAVPHEQAIADIDIPAGQRTAVPLLPTLGPASAFIIRVRASSEPWALAETAVAVG